MKNYGVPITLDVERNLIFNLNVLEKCVEKYQKMDDVLNAFANIKAAKEIGTLMLNEDAEIWNENHPDNPKPLLTEKQLGRLLDNIQNKRISGESKTGNACRTSKRAGC